MGWLTGVFSRLGGSNRCAQEAITGNKSVKSAAMDADINDLVGGINWCLNKDGSNKMTGNLDLNGNSFINFLITSNIAMNGFSISDCNQITCVALVCTTSSLGTAAGDSFTGNIIAENAQIETADITNQVSVISNYVDGFPDKPALFFGNQIHAGGEAYAHIDSLIHLQENGSTIFKIQCVSAGTKIATLNADLSCVNLNVSDVTTTETLNVVTEAQFGDSVQMTGLATSPAGLPIGSVWSDSGTLKIV